MLFALFIRPSPQFDELFELPNQELFELPGIQDEEPELIDGNQLEEELDGYQLDDELEGYQLDDDPEGYQLDELDEEENNVDPSTTPTPRPMPNTARTVEIG